MRKLKWQSFECSYFLDNCARHHKLLLVWLNKPHNTNTFTMSSFAKSQECCLFVAFCANKNKTVISFHFQALSCFSHHISTPWQTLKQKQRGSSKSWRNPKKGFFCSKECLSFFVIVLACFDDSFRTEQIWWKQWLMTAIPAENEMIGKFFPHCVKKRSQDKMNRLNIDRTGPNQRGCCGPQTYWPILGEQETNEAKTNVKKRSLFEYWVVSFFFCQQKYQKNSHINTAKTIPFFLCCWFHVWQQTSEETCLSQQNRPKQKTNATKKPRKASHSTTK